MSQFVGSDPWLSVWPSMSVSESQLCFPSSVADNMLPSTLSCFSSSLKWDKIVGSLSHWWCLCSLLGCFFFGCGRAFLARGQLRFSAFDQSWAASLHTSLTEENTNFVLFYTMVVLAYHISTESGAWRLREQGGLKSCSVQSRNKLANDANW